MVGSAFLADGELEIAVGAGTAVAVGASVDGALNGQESDSAYAKVRAINNAGVSGLTATAANSHTAVFDTVAASGGTATYNLTVNGVNIFSGADNIADGDSLTVDQVAAQVNLYSSQTGVSASVSGTSLTFTSIDGRNTDISETIAGATTDTGIDAAQQGIVRGTITLSAADNITMTEASGSPLAAIGHNASIAKDSGTLANVDVLSVDNSETAINRIDAALTVVSDLRSSFGAIQNRFESTIANLQAVSENLAASRGRIQDADFAAETAALTKAQILQQAGVAVLSQANAQPQLALSLLQ